MNQTTKQTNKEATNNKAKEANKVNQTTTTIEQINQTNKFVEIKQRIASETFTINATSNKVVEIILDKVKIDNFQGEAYKKEVEALALRFLIFQGDNYQTTLQSNFEEDYLAIHPEGSDISCWLTSEANQLLGIMLEEEVKEEAIEFVKGFAFLCEEAWIDQEEVERLDSLIDQGKRWLLSEEGWDGKLDAESALREYFQVKHSVCLDDLDLVVSNSLRKAGLPAASF